MKTKTKRKTSIEVKGAKVHNLKSVDVIIPHKELVVVTGISGSGKSSLAFDTIYAEGQRRYVESLSSYARQFLGRHNKPEVDYIKGIAPAIAIEQKVISTNPRSTVGTVTEIYDYLKLLFARVGKTYSPVSGAIVKKDSVTDVVNYVNSFKKGEKMMVMSPIPKTKKKLESALEKLKSQGFMRVYINDSVLNIEEYTAEKFKKITQAFLVVDRIKSDPENDENNSRIADSVQTAFEQGEGVMSIMLMETQKSKEFSNIFSHDGIEFVEPTLHFFSFNTPFGACDTCEGFGSILGIDENLVIPDTSKSVYEDAIYPWKGDKMGEWKNALIYNAEKFDFPIHKPIHDLTDEQYELLWYGNEFFEGIHAFFDYLKSKSYKIHYRVMMSRYRGKTKCHDCKGTRIRKDASYVKIGGKSIQQLVLMPIDELKDFFDQLKLDKHQAEIAKRILLEINQRLQFMCNVGLSYLTLNRIANTLSGGESQRINLATSLASSLVGSMYILDEPSIGLHERDTHNLIKVLLQLKELGNTVIVVEHDEDIMRAADRIIDMGPGAGRFGGEVVATGTVDEIEKNEKSVTGRYLSGVDSIAIPKSPRVFNRKIKLIGARENNLKNIDVTIPLNAFTCVSGVSGSGKSTLIRSVFYPALMKELGWAPQGAGKHSHIEGDYYSLSDVEMIDQNPIGKSSRSNPASYIKAFDEIRDLFSRQPMAKARNYRPGFFSYNVEGGRCEVCEGEGVVTVSMQFMADVYLNCEACHGKRYKSETLEVKLNGLDISDVLNLTVDESVEFFSQMKGRTIEKLVHKLKTLQKVGLGYVSLGQSSSSLSGGEAQRVKLASYLVKGNVGTPNLFIFDEPSTGLHFQDIKLLLNSFNELINNGHSVLVIEHHPDILKCADWIIDLGPEAGKNGGHLVYEGDVKGLLKVKDSYTGQHLKKKFE